MGETATIRWVLERLFQTPPLGWWGMVILSPIGFRNGYVHLPEGHPAIGIPYDELDAEIHVHGGVTFTDEYPAEQISNGDGIPPGWWVGFDCGHYTDRPEPDVWRAAHAGIPGASIELEWPASLGEGHLWTTDEVAAEVIRLAGQLATMTGREP